jgi:hypothetical protein
LENFSPFLLGWVLEFGCFTFHLVQFFFPSPWPTGRWTGARHKPTRFYFSLITGKNSTCQAAAKQSRAEAIPNQETPPIAHILINSPGGAFTKKEAKKKERKTKLKKTNKKRESSKISQNWLSS